MDNLKKETLHILREFGKTKKDVRWVGCEQFTIDTDLFWELADRKYDEGYGAAEVAPDLLVVGDDWWLERHEYDGSEWWEFKRLPEKPKRSGNVNRIIDSRYPNTLVDLEKQFNEEVDKERWYKGFD